MVDPSSTAYYRWLAVISAAVLYNLLLIIARSVFWQLRDQGAIVWFVLDYSCDLVYLIDMFVQLRTGQLRATRVYRLQLLVTTALQCNIISRNKLSCLS